MAESDSGETKQTTDHDTIRQWTEERGDQPTTVADTMDGDEPGILRFDFEDGEDLESISWEQFFEALEENDLAMVYQENVERGEESGFFTFVSRE